uniref:DOMON domain-containing protein n=1 Tax=Plectus sambesii TaxID=2011161 RepID=A0A914WP50_9BILA
MTRALLAATFCIAFSAASDSFFSHHAALDDGGKFVVRWRPEKEFVTFRCEVQTAGWLGFGFSTNGAMAGADMVIVWIDSSGTPHISDRHGPEKGNGFPEEDASQEYRLIECTRNETHMIAMFIRNLTTCDSNDWTITSDTTRLLWAMSDEVPQSSSAIKQHTSRGVRSAHLLFPQSKTRFGDLMNNPNTSFLDFQLENVKIPHDRQTHYWCQIIELPKKEKHHIVGSQMLVTPGNERYVHHFIVYSCGTKNMSEYIGRAQGCFDDIKSFNPMEQCDNVMAGWAVGGEEFVYPEDLGAPIFGGDERFVMLEMHYDNSQLHKNIVDNSTFRLLLTSDLRAIETGRLTIGLPVSAQILVIPPHQKRFTIYSYCPGECTQRLLEPMKIFTGVLHTHLLGAAIKVRVIRNGVEQRPMMKDDHYDFNYQNPILLLDPTEVYPGDDIIVECTYDTAQRDKAAYGGYSTSEEMCLALMEYYPKRQTSEEFCGSFIQPMEMLKLLGANESDIIMGDFHGITPTYIRNSRGENVTLTEWYESEVAWNDDSARRLQEFMRSSHHSVKCGLKSQSNTTEGPYSINNGTQISAVYIEDNQCLLNNRSEKIAAIEENYSNGSKTATDEKNPYNHLRMNTNAGSMVNAVLLVVAFLVLLTTQIADYCH